MTKKVHPVFAQPLSESSRKMSPMTRNSRMIHRIHRKIHIIVQNAPRSG